MKKIINISAISLLMLLYTDSLMAQPSRPDSPAPFGFVELLVAAGAAYGGKKIYNARKKKEE